MLRVFSSLRREVDAPAALDFHVAVAGHAFQSRGDCRRRHVQFFREPRADRHLVLFQHLPKRFQVIFLRNTGLLASHFVSSIPRYPLPAALPATVAPDFLHAPGSLSKFSDRWPRPRHRDPRRPSLPPFHSPRILTPAPCRSG